MAPDELKTRARRLVEEVLNQDDHAVANELISPDCMHRVPGLAALRDFLALILSIFPDFHAVVEDEVAEDDRVVQRIACHGTHEDEFPASGLAAGPWSSADLPGMLRQLSAPAESSRTAADSSASLQGEPRWRS